MFVCQNVDKSIQAFGLFNGHTHKRTLVSIFLRKMISLASLDMPIQMFIRTYVHKVTSRRAFPCPIHTFLTHRVDSVLRRYLPPSHAPYYKRFLSTPITRLSMQIEKLFVQTTIDLC